MRHAMIMAGGAGTRLWPLSRRDRPKQLLPFIHEGGGTRSLLELAAGRLDGFIPAGQRWICTAEAYRAQIRDALPEFADNRILGEPVGRDTVNAVGFAAAMIERADPDAVFAVLTADHIIRPVGRFQTLLDVGFRLVEEDPWRLVTFSIRPTYAATGYGYVERGSPIRGAKGTDGPPLAYRVARFVEKPDLPRAQAYVESGHFGWNSGMFVWRASTFMECLRRYAPDSHQGLVRIRDAKPGPDFDRVLAEVYPGLPKISVDYAVMEPASREPEVAPPTTGPRQADRRPTVCTVLMDLDWLDVGSWPSYAQTLLADADGNRVSMLGEPGGPAAPVLFDRSRQNVVINAEAGHTVAILGIDNAIVVHTPDATLVVAASRAEELKGLHAKADPRLH